MSYKRGKQKSLSKKQRLAQNFSKAVRAYDSEALARVRQESSQNRFANLSRLKLNDAIARGDVEACKLLREDCDTPFSGQHFRCALLKSDLGIIRWMLEDATESEIKSFFCFENLVTAVEQRHGALTPRMVEEGALYRNRTNSHLPHQKYLVDYAVMTGEPDIIDAALEIEPEGLSPKLYAIALYGACDNRKGRSALIREPEKVYAHLAKKGIKARDALPDVIDVFRSLRNDPDLKPVSFSHNALIGLMIAGLPYDQRNFMSIITELSTTVISKRDERIYDQGVEAVQILGELLEYEDVFLDLPEFEDRIEKLKAVPRIRAQLSDFLQTVAQDYMHHDAPNDGDDWLMRYAL